MQAWHTISWKSPLSGGIAPRCCQKEKRMQQLNVHCKLTDSTPALDEVKHQRPLYFQREHVVLLPFCNKYQRNRPERVDQMPRETTTKKNLSSLTHLCLRLLFLVYTQKPQFYLYLILKHSSSKHGPKRSLLRYYHTL